MLIETTRKDIAWGYASQIFQFGAGFFLLPVVLVKLSSGELAMWYIFLSITTFINMLDFGFQPTIMRNVSYVFSGARTLAKEDIANINIQESVSYELLYAIIKTVKKIYGYTSLLAFVVLVGFGTWYVASVSVDLSDKLILPAWYIYLLSAVFNLYFYYYTPLLLGRGQVMEAHKSIVLSKVSYILIATCGLLAGYGLLAIALGNFIGFIVNRISSHRYFYDKEIKAGLREVRHSAMDEKELFLIIWHNSKKMGLVTIGTMLILKSNLLIGGKFLSLGAVASYGLTLQIFDFLQTVSRVYFQASLPSFTGLMLHRKIGELRKRFFRSMVIGWLVFFVGVAAIAVIGNPLLKLVGSSTLLIPPWAFMLCVLIYLMEITHGNCAILITTTNKIPFVWTTLITGACIFVLSFCLLKYWGMGIEGLLWSTLICQASYNAWKWPLEIIKILNSYDNWK